MEDDLKLQDFDQWVKIFILKHEGGNLSKGSKISGHPTMHVFNDYIFREAAIFLEEGQNNDKFLHHPRDRESLPAYLLVHSWWFNVIDLCVSLVILLLGFIEQDSSTDIIYIFQVPILVHSSIELCGLVLMSVQLYLKTRWLGSSEVRFFIKETVYMFFLNNTWKN